MWMTITTQHLYQGRLLLHLQKKKKKKSLQSLWPPVLDLLDFLNNYEIVSPYVSCVVMIFFWC